MCKDQEPAPLAASAALPAAIQALPHVVQSISDLLLPDTIDAAVYNDLQRVVKAHGDFRRWTHKAMDGAAARGRLDVLNYLLTSRKEGCSPDAMNSAAANGHLKVVNLLYRCCRESCHVVEAFVAAAGNGHDMVTKFLRRILSQVYTNRDAEIAALKAAAANGHVEIVRILLRGTHEFMHAAFEAAATNGRVEVLQFAMERCSEGLLSAYCGPALKHGAKGHVDVVNLLIDKCSEFAIYEALKTATESNDVDSTRLLLERHAGEHFMGLLLQSAVANDQLEMVQLLLEYFLVDAVSSDDDKKAMLSRVLLAAVEAGYADIVKLLADRCKPEIFGDALRNAAVNTGSSPRVVKCMLEACVDVGLETIQIDPFVGLLAAVKAQDAQAAKYFAAKNDCGRVGYFLADAVTGGCLDLVKVLTEFSNSDFSPDALIRAAKTDQHDILLYLLQYCDQKSIKLALAKAADSGKLETVKVLFDTLESSSPRQMNVAGSRRAAVKRGYNPAANVLSEGGANALIAAASRGHLEVVESLQVRCRPCDIRAAREVAHQHGHSEIAQFLNSKRARLP